MISAVQLWEDFVIDDANKDMSGDVSIARFNRYLWRAQLKLMDWLSGNFDNKNYPPPEQVSTKKTRDWLAPFLVKLPKQVSNGEIERPTNYYLFKDLYRLKGVSPECIDEYNEDDIKVVKVPVELLDSGKFNNRCDTKIRRLDPLVKPIAKLSGAGFEFAPDDLGSVLLEYYRYPVKAEVVAVYSAQYNNEEPNEAASTPVEFNEGCRPYLIYFLNMEFSKNVREVGFQQQNEMSKP